MEFDGVIFFYWLALDASRWMSHISFWTVLLCVLTTALRTRYRVIKAVVLDLRLLLLIYRVVFRHKVHHEPSSTRSATPLLLSMVVMNTTCCPEEVLGFLFMDFRIKYAKSFHAYKYKMLWVVTVCGNHKKCDVLTLGYLQFVFLWGRWQSVSCCSFSKKIMLHVEWHSKYSLRSTLTKSRLEGNKKKHYF